MTTKDNEALAKCFWVGVLFICLSIGIHFGAWLSFLVVGTVLLGVSLVGYFK